MAVKFKPSIFREYDIRGLAEEELSSDFARCLGSTYALLLKEKKPRPKTGSTYHVAIGRDCRLTSDAYAEALGEGLRSQGVQVTFLGVCPTPLTYFSLFHLPVDGAIMVTGSHNPAPYNGFKICVGTDTLHGKEIQKIRTMMEKNQEIPSTQKGPAPTQYAIIPAYIEYLKKTIPRLPRRRIVLDAGNGTASTVAPLLFESLGAEVIPLFCELDGRFPNHHPDPTVPENLETLIETVRSKKADLGIAFDGDSDRIGVVNEKGEILFGDELMVLLAREVLRKNPGATILSEVKSSYRLYDDIQAKGGRPIMWKTGHSLIKSKMKETGALLAGEMSGHIFFADRYFGYDDALYAGIRVYEIATQTEKPFSTHLADLPKTVCTPELRVDCPDEQKFQIVEQVKSSLPADLKINDIDGVRADFGDGWGLLRASNTQPVLVLRFEATSARRLSEIRKIMEGVLLNVSRESGLSLKIP